MFETLRAPAPDKILHLMRAFAEDPRPDKIDLGVGVYRSAEGTTPIMRAVRAAAARLHDTEATKSYVALAGDPAFHDALRGLVLANSVAADRVAALATPGGTGAVRQAFELIARSRPGGTVWLTDPTWVNHESILDTMGLDWRQFRYLDDTGTGLAGEAMLRDLSSVAANDVILLHGCCHNPTGIDLSLQDWQAVATLATARGALVMVDLAYQGFGEGIAADVAGVRALVSTVPEALITVSGSKTFGLYRDRVGLVLAICKSPRERETVQAVLAWLNRQAYAFPPDHGARIVTSVLADPGLRADWETELEQMRRQIIAMRRAFAAALAAETGSDRFAFLETQKGLFSRLGATPDQVEALRRDHGLYMVGDSRINLAGLTASTIPPAARAIARVLG